MEPDYLVVGSGLAGLSFAALMSRAGRRVTIVEAHDKPGGYAQTFEIGKHRFNAQLHYVWNVGPDRTVGRFLSRLGVERAVEFVKLDDAGYDHMRIPGYALDIPGDFAELARRLASLFPAHAAALTDFVDEVRLTDEELEAMPSSLADIHVLRRSHGFRRLLRHRNATLDDVFERFQLPPAARALIALQWPDFMLPPKSLSFFAWVKLFGGYARGAYYPKKHFHHVIDTLADVVRAGGGEVRLRSRVTRFLLEGSRMRGVEIEEVDERGIGTGRFETIRAREVVCNMDPRQAAEMIGLERFSSRVRARLAYQYSPSSFVAYCSISDLDLRAHGFGAWNVFHAEDPDIDRLFWSMHDHGDYSKPSFAMSTPTLVSSEPGDCPEGRQVLELLTVASHARFIEKRRGNPAAYREAKQAVLDAMLDVVERDYLPSIREHLPMRVLGTPATNERFVRAPLGNTYGSIMTPRGIWRGRLDHRTSIEGFHFCNASSGYAGFAGTIWTGSRLYERLSGDRFLGRDS